MKIFSYLEESAGAYELAQRLVSLNFRCFMKGLNENGFFGEGLSYLDVGCGTGFLRDHLKSSRYLGVDINERYISYATKQRGNHFMLGDVTSLSNVTDRYDRVVCLGLFHHLDDEQVRLGLRNCASKLSDGGQIFIFDALRVTSGNPVGTWLRDADNGLFVRKLDEWQSIFESELKVEKLVQDGQWPFDYVFCKATSRRS